MDGGGGKAWSVDRMGNSEIPCRHLGFVLMLSTTTFRSSHVFPADRQVFPVVIAVLSTLVFSCGPAAGWQTDAASSAPSDAEQQRFFETRIRPLLARHCYKCHSVTSAEPGGKLLLDHAAGLLTGGESGAAIIPGNAADSLLVQALHADGLQMPPEMPLAAAEIADVETWIQRGAYDPRTVVPAAEMAADQTQLPHWAWIPPQQPQIPELHGDEWSVTDIDRFVLAAFEQAQKPLPADAAAGIVARRLYQNLLGLPPTADEQEEAETLLRQESRSGLISLVDRLLSSPHFGERWGRHWLDVARYGESNGNDGLGRNPTFPHAWRYRDYVIAAINQDMPWDQFLREQLAGDLLPAESPVERDRLLTATGFLALSAKPAKAMNDDFEMDIVADQIDLIGRGILGVSVACARCHDHKTDPIPTAEYYALAGILTSTETLWGLAANEGLTAPKTDLHVLQAAPKVPPPDDFVETVLVLESNTGLPKPVPKPPWPAGTPLAMGVRDRAKPADCPINIKGSSAKKGEVVPRGFLKFCTTDAMAAVAVNSQQSGRAELAAWITHPQHPLTARVLVNRVWGHLFGRGIVPVADEFGRYGEAPASQELLDYLAVRFVQDGWSLKRLIRSIVLSRTWQLAVASESADSSMRIAGILPCRRRLDAESFRDSVLRVSGQLNPEPAQGSLIRHRDILVNLAGNLHEPSDHRSVYLCYLRSSLPPELTPFDLPDFTVSVGQRGQSTIPAQGLFLLNNPFMHRQSAALSELVQQQAQNQRQRLEFLWKQVLQRAPDSEELLWAEGFLGEEQDSEQTWQALCQSLLMTSEFRYLD